MWINECSHHRIPYTRSNNLRASILMNLEEKWPAKECAEYKCTYVNFQSTQNNVICCWWRSRHFTQVQNPPGIQSVPPMSVLTSRATTNPALDSFCFALFVLTSCLGSMRHTVARMILLNTRQVKPLVCSKPSNGSCLKNSLRWTARVHPPRPSPWPSDLAHSSGDAPTLLLEPRLPWPGKSVALTSVLHSSSFFRSS